MAHALLALAESCLLATQESRGVESNLESSSDYKGMHMTADEPVLSGDEMLESPALELAHPAEKSGFLPF